MSPKTKKQFEEMRERSRKLIRENALRLFAQKGYHATSMNVVAREAGISKGLLYNYYSGKEQLIDDVMAMAFEQGDQMMKGIANYSPEQQLEIVFEAFFRDIVDNQQFWKLMVSLAIQVDQFPFIKKQVQNKIEEYFQIIGELLQAINYPNAETEAKLIAALFDGIGIEYVLMGEEYPLEEVKQHLIQKYCRNTKY